VTIPSVPHGGDIHAAARQLRSNVQSIYDFSASINPLGLPPSVKKVIEETITLLGHYPDLQGYDACNGLAHHHRLSKNHFVLGNGSTELIYALPSVLGIRHGLIVGPTFGEYERALRIAGCQRSFIFAERKTQFTPPISGVRQLLQRQQSQSKQRTRKKGRGQPIDAIFLCNPNSPTGQIVPKKDVLALLEFVEKCKVRLIVDEAFIDFCENHSVLRSVRNYQQLLVLRSFTKFYAMPGLRIGYVCAPPSDIKKFRACLPPWSVNVLAQKAAQAALLDRRYRERSLAYMKEERRRLIREIRKIPSLRVFPSQANFLLGELPQSYSSRQLEKYLRAKGILIRNCDTFSGMSPQMVRFAVRRRGENNRLLSGMQKIFSEFNS
jgi:threonine-phosphate decarboxylase